MGNNIWQMLQSRGHEIWTHTLCWNNLEEKVVPDSPSESSKMLKESVSATAECCNSELLQIWKGWQISQIFSLIIVVAIQIELGHLH